jgi:WD40 repeat protein
LDKICPYPGLRPFNEEESIFFKGREDHIETIIAQLQEKKFLMVTGASGDGKSSLIYAGLIPRAKAGFFKSKYNKWVIIDLKPEKAPLTNLSVSLCRHLGLADAAAVEEDLGYGFSSLIKVIGDSGYCPDDDQHPPKAGDVGSEQMAGKPGSNILILIDQFEELFTNADNFKKGKPSVQALTLINLIIETTRITEARDLPIYIVCTMRSDYVGDCAAFKGLPELIVYSQFFVPRLKRQEIHRAIAEPARLSANKISNSLVEKLINDSGEGLDQLPILQHALNRIWKSHIDDGEDEMELIHYAKVGGFSARLLPAVQKKKYHDWLENEEENKRKFLLEPSLSNVLNAHARELFENSAKYCRSHTGLEIPDAECHQLLRQIFTCLTKINENRAVRNRASVLEIKRIISDDIDNRMIEGLINLFREPGNSLLRPFISANPESLVLNDNDTIDITHEALIRKWSELVEWTKKDHENVHVISDLKMQVRRWEDRHRSKDYLLTVGSLSYFKSWHNKAQPNPYFIAKHDVENKSNEKKLTEATTFVTSAEDFLRISEAGIKRKRRTLVSITAAVLLILLGFTAWAFTERNKALDKEDLANRKTEEALKSEQFAEHSSREAVNAKNMALALKDSAQKSEKAAVRARLVAERSKSEALTAKQIAEGEKKRAEIQAELARKEKTNAETQKQTAEAEKLKAEKAEQRSEKLKGLSVAQNLALKSALYKKNPELMGQLAVHAYRLNKSNGGHPEDAVIYEGLRSAFATLDKGKQTIAGGYPMEVRAAAEINSGSHFISADLGGNLYLRDLQNNSLKKIFQTKLGSPISFVFISPTANYLITGSDDYLVHLFDIRSVSQEDRPTPLMNELVGHKGLLRAVAFNENEQLFATSGKDSLIMVWDLQPGKARMKSQVKVSAAVKSLVIISKLNLLISAQEDGKVTLIDLEKPGINILTEQAGLVPLSLAIHGPKNILMVGWSDASLQCFDLSSYTPGKKVIPLTFSPHRAGIELIAFNHDCSLIATSAADKSIHFYNFNDYFNSKNKLGVVTQLKDHNSKVRSLVFTHDNKILAGCSDRSIRIWETSAELLVRKICEGLKNNVSEADWKNAVGDDIPFGGNCNEQAQF